MVVRLSDNEWQTLRDVFKTAGAIEDGANPDNADLLVDEQLADMYAGARFIQDRLRAIFGIRE